MRMPSAAQRKLLDQATATYQKESWRAATYLAGRGIDPEATERWRLGVVSSPEPGHEWFLGRLSIPYTNKLGVMALKFRCLQEHDCKASNCKKYMWPDGQEMYVFNVGACDTAEAVIHVAEGEVDAIILAEAFGQPAVGVPGVGVWQQHWPFHFQGFERVIVWPDGDKAGRDWASKVRKEISQAEIMQMPSGKDVNDLYLEAGTEALKALAGIDESEVAHA